MCRPYSSPAVSLQRLLIIQTLTAIASPAFAAESLRQVEIVDKAGSLPAGAQFGPILPGLDQRAVPQGLAYLPAQDWFLISLYRDEPEPAAFLVAGEAAGECRMARCLSLLEEDGRPHTGHVGGIAVNDRWIWIGSGSNVFQIPVNAVTGGDAPDTVRMTEVLMALGSASFVAIHDATLWVGEFVIPGSEKYPGYKKSGMRDRRGDPVRAWLAGYTLGKDGALTTTAPGHQALVPDKLLTIPEKAQGVAFYDNLVLVSSSWGPHASRLHAFVNPLADAATKHHDTVLIGKTSVPLWFLDTPETPTWQPSPLPAYAEGIAVRNNMLAVVFESGAEKYREQSERKKYPDPPVKIIDRLILYPMTRPE